MEEMYAHQASVSCAPDRELRAGPSGVNDCSWFINFSHCFWAKATMVAYRHVAPKWGALIPWVVQRFVFPVGFLPGFTESTPGSSIDRAGDKLFFWTCRAQRFSFLSVAEKSETRL